MTRHSIAIEANGQRWDYPNTPLGRLRAWFRERLMLGDGYVVKVDRTNMPMRRIRP